MLRRIGELGPIQLKLFVLIGLAHIWSGLCVLSLTYVGTDPGWECKAVADPVDRVGAAVENLTDRIAKCTYYEQGECIPKYSKEYTSIVTEVIESYFIIYYLFIYFRFYRLSNKLYKTKE